MEVRCPATLQSELSGFDDGNEDAEMRLFGVIATMVVTVARRTKCVPERSAMIGPEPERLVRESS